MMKAQDKKQTNILDVKMLGEYLKCLDTGEFPLNGATSEMNANLLRVTQLLQQGRLQMYFKIHGSIKEFLP